MRAGLSASIIGFISGPRSDTCVGTLGGRSSSRPVNFLKIRSRERKSVNEKEAGQFGGGTEQSCALEIGSVRCGLVYEDAVGKWGTRTAPPYRGRYRPGLPEPYSS